jgi:hypothetical protein
MDENQNPQAAQEQETELNELQQRAMTGQALDAGTSPQGVIDEVNARGEGETSDDSTEGEPEQGESAPPETPVANEFGYGTSQHRRD